MSLAPLTPIVGQPLRIAVYERIAAAIRAGDYPLGSLLPSDAEMTAQLGISRTVVREAFLLLEEDHLIRTRRGVGRFVVHALPAIGLERLRPIEAVLRGDDEPVLVQRLVDERQGATDFVATGLGVDAGAQIRALESVVLRGGSPVCVSYEYLPLPDAGADVRAIETPPTSHSSAKVRTALAEVLEREAGAALRGRCEFGAGLVGEARGQRLDLEAGTPVLIVTQRVALGPRALYLAKHVVAAAAGPIVLTQLSAAMG